MKKFLSPQNKKLKNVQSKKIGLPINGIPFNGLGLTVAIGLIGIIVSLASIIISIISITSINNTTTNNNFPFLGRWTEYESNPIYSPFDGTPTYYPCVLYFGINDYRMWHQGKTLGNGTDIFGYSTSADGINWTLIDDVYGISGSGYHPWVIYDPNGFGGTHNFKIYFWSGSATTDASAIKTAESDDGIVWFNTQTITQNSTAELIEGVSGELLFHNYGPASVYYNPNATSIPDNPWTWPYVMFYDVSAEGNDPGVVHEASGFAFSSDGIGFTRSVHGKTPAFSPEGSYSYKWDGGYRYGSRVIFDEENNLYRMFYNGANFALNGTGAYYARGIGEAISYNGITWSVSPLSPILHYQDGIHWRSDRTYTPCVLFGRFGGTTLQYKMWFTGAKTLGGSIKGIGYATYTIN